MAREFVLLLRDQRSDRWTVTDEPTERAEAEGRIAALITANPRGRVALARIVRVVRAVTVAEDVPVE